MTNPERFTCVAEPLREAASQTGGFGGEALQGRQLMEGDDTDVAGDPPPSAAAAAYRPKVEDGGRCGSCGRPVP